MVLAEMHPAWGDVVHRLMYTRFLFLFLVTAPPPAVPSISKISLSVCLSVCLGVRLLSFRFFIHAVMSSVSDISELLDESLKMKSFSHPNILNLIGVCVDVGPAPYVVMPYMERGSLLHFLKKERPHFTLAEGADSELVSPIPKLHHPIPIPTTPHSHSKTGSSLRPSSSVFV